MYKEQQIKVMGILNATPDSFSDGSEEYLDCVRQVQRALQMIAQGADIIDIGGESTRPGAAFIPADEEIRRVIPVLRELRRQSDVCISIDTNKAAVAQAALAEGADIINDITAFSDPRMARTVADNAAEVVLMHMQGIPENMQHAPAYGQVVDEVYRYLQERMDVALSAGIAREKIIIDPGFGFGKRLEDNCLLFKNLDRFNKLGCRLLVGVSRKSMIGQALNVDVTQRLEGSLALAVYAQLKGAAILRVHDVLATRRAVDMISAVENA